MSFLLTNLTNVGMVYFTIYKIINKINGKTYIGKHQTNDLNDGYFGSGKMLKRAIKKYGIENFKKEILFVFDTEAEMNYKEKELVEVGPNSYNLCEGGQGGFGYINSKGMNGSQLGVEKRLKLSETSEWFKNFEQKRNEGYQKFINENPSFIEKFIERSKSRKGCPSPTKGTKHSEKTILLIKEKAKGRGKGETNSQYGTCWIYNNKINKKIKIVELENYLNEGWVKGRK